MVETMVTFVAIGIFMLLTAASAGVLAVLIEWGVSCTRCTGLRELPEKPIPMEHEHGGKGNAVD